jgi:hypothetical protein
MTNASCDLFEGKTLYIIGGSTEILRLTIKNAMTNEDVELRSAKEIEWLLTTYSVKSRYSVVHKNLSSGDIKLLVNPSSGVANILQVTINNEDTKDLQGAFIHQIAVTDGKYERFVPFQGLIVIGKGIRSE